MKKNKLNKLVKAARKKVRKNIEQSLVTELEIVSIDLGQDSKGLKKGIKKGSKELAKKLSKKIRIDKPTLLAASQKTKTVKTPAASQSKVAKPAATAAKTTASSGTKQPSMTTRSSKPATAEVKPVDTETENTKV